MRIRRLLVLLAVSLSLLSCSKHGSDPVFHDAQGNQVQLSEAKGKWVVVNYWADWCHTCLHEVPALNSFYQDNKDKDVMLIGVNYDQLQDVELKNSIAKVDIQFPVLTQDPNSQWKLGEVIVLPTTFIINPQGKVVKKIEGSSSEELLTDLINSLRTTTTA